MALTNTGRPNKVLNPKPLTPREWDLGPLMAAGLSVKEIAYALNIAYVTVKVAATKLQRKFGASNRAEFVRAWEDLPRVGNGVT